MARTVDDIHSFDVAFSQAMDRFENAEIRPEDRKILESFFRSLRRDRLAKVRLYGT